MKILVGNDQDRPPLVRPLISIIILVLLTIGAFLYISRHYINSLFDGVENQYRQGLINIVSVARSAVEPVLMQFRSREIGREEAIRQMRVLVRTMTYEDQDGKNYIFSSSYDGTMLVQPYDPGKELTNQLELQDIKGLYIIRELIKAAKAHPDGSFVRYHYHLPGVHDLQEKLAYVVGLPELECYIGTGMYMQRALQEQRAIIAKVEHAAVCLLIAVLIPIAVLVFTMLNRNRRLLAEVEVRKKAEEELAKSEEKYRSIFENAVEGMFRTSSDGRLISVNPALARSAGYESVQEMITSVASIDQHYVDPGERRKFLQILHEKGFVEDHVMKMRARDGRLVWASVNARAVRDEAGNVTYCEGTIVDISRRKQAEDKFAKIFMTTPDGIIISRMKDGLIMDVNPAFEDISGWTRGEVLGRTGREINIWSDMAEREVVVGELLTGRDIVHRESHLRRKDGTMLDTIYSARTIHLDGELCLLIILWDITERKRVEEELKANESMLRSLFAVTPIGITFCKDRVILVANDFMCDLMGYRQQELVGDTGRKFFVTEQEYEEVCREIDSQIPRTGRWRTETRHVRKDGYILDVILSGALLRAEDPSAGHVIAVRDVTQSRRAEEEARRLRNYLSSIIDSMPSVLVGVDEKGCVTQWNAAAERTTGVKGEMARGRPLDQVLPMLRRQLDELRQAMRTRTVSTQAKVPRRVDGELRYEDVTVYPLMSNGVEGAVIRLDDVTERVRIEEMMVQSEKMLSVGGLAAGMAHEINNPLGVILQAAQNILRRVSPDLPANARAAEECGISLDSLQQYLACREILIFLEDIRQSGERAAEIVANMLSFSRKAEGGGVPVDLAELLDRTVSLAASDYDLKKRYDFRKLEIVREYQPAVPRVLCQVGKIQQVFLNILRNGAEAMMAEKGSGRVAQFVLRVLRDGVMVRVEIEDNGPGMDEATRKRVFEPFFTTKPPGVGTGLGLSVSYFIVTEDHQGSMSVESSPGMGSRFIIRLPVMGQRG